MGDFNLAIGLIAATEAGQQIVADARGPILSDLADTLGRAPTSAEVAFALNTILRETVVFVCQTAINKGASDEQAATVGRAVVEAYEAAAGGVH